MKRMFACGCGRWYKCKNWKGWLVKKYRCVKHHVNHDALMLGGQRATQQNSLFVQVRLPSLDVYTPVADEFSARSQTHRGPINNLCGNHCPPQLDPIDNLEGVWSSSL